MARLSPSLSLDPTTPRCQTADASCLSEARAFFMYDPYWNLQLPTKWLTFLDIDIVFSINIYEYMSTHIYLFFLQRFKMKEQ